MRPIVRRGPQPSMTERTLRFIHGLKKMIISMAADLPGSDTPAAKVVTRAAQMLIVGL